MGRGFQKRLQAPALPNPLVHPFSVPLVVALTVYTVAVGAVPVPHAVAAVEWHTLVANVKPLLSSSTTKMGKPVVGYLLVVAAAHVVA